MLEIQKKGNVAKEIIIVLKNMDQDIVNKIPTKLLEQFEKIAEFANSDIKVNLKEKLKYQDISEESKDILSILYYKYIANEQEKTRIFNIWKENEKSSIY